MRLHSCLRRRGFLTFDVASGLVLGLFLLMALTAVIVKQRQAENRLAAVRTAARAAETSLLNLQAGLAADKAAAVEKLADAAPPGKSWVRLTIPSHEKLPGASIVGLVPSAAAPAGDNLKPNVER